MPAVERDPPVEVAVVGGGPAGAVAVRLLTQWGHRVRLLAREDDPARSNAESLPPSSLEVLRKVGLLDTVAAAGFHTSTGNTVWWDGERARVEPFEAGAGVGLQVERAAFDGVLLRAAEAAGTDVRRGAVVTDTQIAGCDDARVEYVQAGVRRRTRCRLVIDASGRAGVVARRMTMRRYETGLRMLAVMGMWRRSDGWAVPDPSQTLVEAYDDGWAWSVPVSPDARHMAVMVDPARARPGPTPRMEAMYRAELSRARHIGDLTVGSELRRVWACDASLYACDQLGGDGWLLVGDTAATLDPLSSFGLKKALASAWLGAVVAHTVLRHPSRHRAALDLYERWTRDIVDTNLQRTRAFAGRAHARLLSSFWAARQHAPPADPSESGRGTRHLLTAPGVREALVRLRERPRLDLDWRGASRVVACPAIHGHEVVLETGLRLLDHEPGIRFLDGVDLIALGELAPHCRQVPDLVDAYCQRCTPRPFPHILAALSVLVAFGVLEPQKS